MPVFQTLLTPIDGSDPSNAACALAIKLAADARVTLVFVNVVESDKIVASVMPGQGFADPTPAIDSLRAAGAAMLNDAVAQATAAGVKATQELAEGDCIETILDCAKSHAVDLIVIGSHGRSGLQRLMLGSVAEGVLRHSPVPVLVTKASKP
jgi:nucleotide-binding universal stress UspA family protein